MKKTALENDPNAATRSNQRRPAFHCNFPASKLQWRHYKKKDATENDPVASHWPNKPKAIWFILPFPAFFATGVVPELNVFELVRSRLEASGCEPRHISRDTIESRCPAHLGSRRNLSVTLADSGKVLIHCHRRGEGADCSFEQIIGSLSLTMEDLGMGNGNGAGTATAQSRPLKPQRQPVKKPKVVCRSLDECVTRAAKYLNARHVETYLYPPVAPDRNWAVVRFAAEGGKTFRSFHQVEEGWAFGDPEGPLSLYSKGVEKGSPVIVVEGERKVNAVAALGYWAVSSSHGAGSAHRSDWSPLSGRFVAIWPDNDEEGRKHAAKVADLLQALKQPPTTITILSPEKLGLTAPKADAVDYCGNTEQLRRVIAASPQIKPTPLATNAAKAVNSNSPPPKLQLNSVRAPHPNHTNVMRILESIKPEVWFDEFYGSIMVRDPKNQQSREWSDDDDLALTLKIQEGWIPTISVGVVQSTVLGFAKQKITNEPRDWVDSLVWDRKPRISRFFPDYYGCDDNEYSRSVSRNFWVSLIARIYDPGCQVDTMPVLEGSQGIFKSTSLAAIGGKWFAVVSEPPTQKDFYLSLRGKILFEVGELHSFAQAEITATKRAISTQTDRYRSPYDRRAADHPRRCVFAGTTNRDDWHRDETGGRRFWPIACREIRIDQIRRDREQFFAEALHEFRTDRTWWVVPESAKAEIAARRQPDPWDTPVANWIMRRDFVKTFDILVEALKIEVGKQGVADQRRVGSILRWLGWTSGLIRREGQVVRGWFPPKQDPEVSNVTHETDRNAEAF